MENYLILSSSIIYTLKLWMINKEHLMDSVWKFLEKWQNKSILES